jgi:radical SAM protein with 4Fe4S-binding SPASM domain
MFWVLEQTNHCNLRCITCPNRLHNRPRGYMTPETFKDIINQLLVEEKNNDIKKERVVLHGIGEPLLSPYFFNNLDYLDEKGFEYVDFSDNGMLMTEENANKLCSYKCLYNLRVSLNSSRKEIMERLNTGSCFEKVVENIKNLIKIRAKYPTKIRIDIQYIKSKANEDETENEIRKLIGGGKYYVSEKRINNFSGLVSQNEFTYPNEIYREQCEFDKTGIMFHWDGDIVGCCDDDTKTQVIGNIKDGLYSEKIQNKMKTYRQMLKEKDFSLLPVCKKCLYV